MNAPRLVMDYDSINDNSRTSFSSDSVQWQGTQTACAALDSLLSEAAFTSQSESFQSLVTKEASRNRLHESLPHRTTALLSSSQPSTNGVSSWNSSSNDHRSRPTRSSTSSTIDTLPVGDPDQFLSMLKGISQRIDSNIRSDAGTPRDNLRRRPPSKRTTNSSSATTRRTRHAVLSKSSSRSTPEGPDKGKGRELGMWSSTSTDTVHLVGGSSRHPQSRDDQLDNIISDAMEVDLPSPSFKIMPPPPVPLLRANPSAIAHTAATAPPSQSMNDDVAPLPLRPGPPPKPPSQARNPFFSTPTAPSPTPKLHPLLDNERKQRRLKLERTISASLASLPANPIPASEPPSQVISPPVPKPSSRPPSNRLASLPLSQNRVVNGSRPPSLGMRRTHTFPLRDGGTNGAKPKVPPPSKQKSFRPPLLSSSQPPSTSSTTSSRSTVPSSHSSEQSCASPYASPATSTDTPGSKFSDENLEDLPLNSDADISFGDAIALDVDMDALEETMRKYD